MRTPRRRDVLKAVAGAAALPTAARANLDPFTHGPAVFPVAPDTVAVWARARHAGPVSVRYGTTPFLDGAPVGPTMHAGPETDYTVAVPLAGLPRGQRLYVQPITLDGDRRVGPVGTFTAGAAEDEIRIAWGADLLASYRPFEIFDVLRAARPGLLLLLGDTAYVDHTHPGPPILSNARAAHRLVRDDPALQLALREVPVAAVWDDHEVKNDFDRTHPWLRGGRRAFRDYWGAPPAPDGGLYRSIRWDPRVEVILLDCRSFRDPPGWARDPARSMLGAPQLAWLKTRLAETDAEVVLIGSSVPLLSPFKRDTWSGYRVERDAVVAAIRDARPTVVVVSGDLHLAWDLERAGVREFVAGPMGAWPFGHISQSLVPTVKASGRFSLVSRLNFGMVRITGSGDALRVEVQIIDQRGLVRHGAGIPTRSLVSRGSDSDPP